jgi:hypothetical protein
MSLRQSADPAKALLGTPDHCQQTQKFKSVFYGTSLRDNLFACKQGANKFPSTQSFDNFGTQLYFDNQV